MIARIPSPSDRSCHRCQLHTQRNYLDLAFKSIARTTLKLLRYENHAQSRSIHYLHLLLRARHDHRASHSLDLQSLPQYRSLLILLRLPSFDHQRQLHHRHHPMLVNLNLVANLHLVVNLLSIRIHHPAPSQVARSSTRRNAGVLQSPRTILRATPHSLHFQSQMLPSHCGPC